MAKTERFEMRLDEGTIDQVDAWRARQGDSPSRAEAVRRLINLACSVASDMRLKFSAGEQLQLHLLCELYKNNRVDGELDPEFVQKALWSGHLWALKWKYPGIFHGTESNEAAVHEVVRILTLWQYIERGFNRLSRKEKELLAEEAKPFGKHVRFPGFDGNTETDAFSIAKFLVEDLERFSIFKGRDLNSHAPTMPAYSRMLSVFEPIQRRILADDLNVRELAMVLREMVHPSNRTSTSA